ncbi:hypothetical protein T4A_1951 [Trichinella pseudospiralis]|uniref:Uncharacterized protein n=1 Tax=Trichinella pseudospiralis TaxID=6337 RepID=A0A0V1EAX7_TRIPS|nr:hypothetical protein T4A_1951 [Trichinella pseudospiralis]
MDAKKTKLIAKFIEISIIDDGNFFCSCLDLILMKFISSSNKATDFDYQIQECTLPTRLVNGENGKSCKKWNNNNVE